MWLDWISAKGGRFAGVMWRLLTTKTPATEKQFKKEFGFEPNLNVSDYVYGSDMFRIRERLKELVKDWLDADERMRIAHENLAKSRQGIQRMPSLMKNSLDLRLAHNDLERFDRDRIEKWNHASRACMLPAIVGYFEVSTDVGAYLPPAQSVMGRVYK